MTNLYVLGNAGSAPSGWTKITTYDGYYLRFGNSYAGHGTTGGSATHTHGSSGVTIGNCSGSSFYFNLTGTNMMKVHSGTLNITSGTSGSNTPPYYELELYRINLTTWETSHKYFPVGSILLSDSVLSGSEMSRFSSPDGRLLKFGSPGLTGGTAGHTHAVAGNVSCTSLNLSVGSYDDGDVSNPTDHTHAWSTTSNSQDVTPLRLQTRFYRVNQLVNRALTGAICFVDDTPSANWDLMSGWNGYFAESLDGYTTTGSNAHEHNGLSTTSANYTASVLRYRSGTTSRTFANRPHNHTVAFNLASADHTPQYVTLIPVKLNTTLYRPMGRSICVSMC